MAAKYKYKYTTGPFTLPQNAQSIDWSVLNNDPKPQKVRVTVFKCVVLDIKTTERPGPLEFVVDPGFLINNANKAVNESVPCDIEALRLQRPEIDVKIKDGPLVKFDRYTDLKQAVSTLQRVIAEKEATGAQIIDIRFQERVYIK